MFSHWKDFAKNRHGATSQKPLLSSVEHHHAFAAGVLYSWQTIANVRPTIRQVFIYFHPFGMRS